MSEQLYTLNKKLLAFLGTLILAGIIFFIVIGGSVLVWDIFLSDEIEVDDSNALRVETVEEPLNPAEIIEGESDAKISLLSPRRIDSTQALFLIPVSRISSNNINKGRLRKNQSLDLFNSSGSYESYESYHENNGPYNNLIIYYQQENRKATIFEDKINIQFFNYHEIGAKHYVTIVGEKLDTNRDGKLSSSDLKSFYIYDIAKGELKSFEYEQAGFVDITFLTGREEAIIAFAEDINKNGKTDFTLDPVFLVKYSFAEEKREYLIDEEMTEQLEVLIK